MHWCVWCPSVHVWFLDSKPLTNWLQTLYGRRTPSWLSKLTPFYLFIRLYLFIFFFLFCTLMTLKKCFGQLILRSATNIAIFLHFYHRNHIGTIYMWLAHVSHATCCLCIYPILNLIASCHATWGLHIPWQNGCHTCDWRIIPQVTLVCHGPYFFIYSLFVNIWGFVWGKVVHCCLFWKYTHLPFHPYTKYHSHNIKSCFNIKWPGAVFTNRLKSVLGLKSSTKW